MENMKINKELIENIAKAFGSAGTIIVVLWIISLFG